MELRVVFCSQIHPVFARWMLAILPIASDVSIVDSLRLGVSTMHDIEKPKHVEPTRNQRCQKTVLDSTYRHKEEVFMNFT